MRKLYRSFLHPLSEGTRHLKAAQPREHELDSAGQSPASSGHRAHPGQVSLTPQTRGWVLLCRAPWAPWVVEQHPWPPPSRRQEPPPPASHDDAPRRGLASPGAGPQPQTAARAPLTPKPRGALAGLSLSPGSGALGHAVWVSQGVCRQAAPRAPPRPPGLPPGAAHLAACAGRAGRAPAAAAQGGAAACWEVAGRGRLRGDSGSRSLDARPCATPQLPSQAATRPRTAALRPA